MTTPKPESAEPSKCDHVNGWKSILDENSGGHIGYDCTRCGGVIERSKSWLKMQAKPETAAAGPSGDTCHECGLPEDFPGEHAHALPWRLDSDGKTMLDSNDGSVAEFTTRADAELAAIRCNATQLAEPVAQAKAWAICKVVPGIGRMWFRRDRWESDAAVAWKIDPAGTLTFPTRAEAEMFAREYMPELESEVEFVELRAKPVAQGVSRERVEAIEVKLRRWSNELSNEFSQRRDGLRVAANLLRDELAADRGDAG